MIHKGSPAEQGVFHSGDESDNKSEVPQVVHSERFAAALETSSVGVLSVLMSAYALPTFD